MAKLEVKYDPTLEQSEIVTFLGNSSVEESGDDYKKNMVDQQQTAIYGIHCPIIAVNNVMVAVDDILSFELDDSKHVPQVSLHIIDRKHLIQYLDTPDNDNELRIQILPPFDDIYKKINLTFLITSFSQGGRNDLFISGKYKLSKFTSSQFKSFGEISLYDLFDQIASDSKLGFATNVEQRNDERFVYCPYISYQDTIEKEISHSGDETTIYDWWIDVWNYLNLANIYERYKSIDQADDMKIWVSGNDDDITQGVKSEPQECVAELTNLFGSQETQLYVKQYRIKNKPGTNIISGTDKVYSVYSMENNEYQDTYISNGDVKKDIFNNFEYKGEVYGEYDYITNGMYREPFTQKIKNELIEVDLCQPLLGIQRGNQVMFACYYIDSTFNYIEEGLKNDGLYNDDAKTEVPIMTPDDIGQETMKVNKSISGQYMVYGNIYRYNNRRWTHTIILARPSDQKPKLLKEEE